MSHSRRQFVLVVLVLFALGASGAGAALTVGGDAAVPVPEGGGFCFADRNGLGQCADPSTPCFQLSECDAETPCPDGTFCAFQTACIETTLPGVCVPAFADGGCSNPGSLETGHFPCEPVVFYEDFVPVLKAGSEAAVPPPLHQMTTSVACGEGFLYADDTCTDNAGAPTPLDVARFGDPADCGVYASAGVRISASTGAIDISGCAGAELTFDYLFDLNQSARFDRGFVTVSIDGGLARVVATNQILGAQAFESSWGSCGGSPDGGTVLPVGSLVQDGQWHHYRAGIGSGSSATVTFYAETSDGVNNAGQGWLFDDLRVDCGVLVFDDGFEGANLLRWSFTTAPPLIVAVDNPGSCLEDPYFQCGGPESGCYNFTTAEGPTLCLSNFSCFIAEPCFSGSGDCAANEVCVVDSCCEIFGPEGIGGGVCIPLQCDPGSFVSQPSGATGASL